jgi:hypothetical protein
VVFIEDVELVPPKQAKYRASEAPNRLKSDSAATARFDCSPLFRNWVVLKTTTFPATREAFV